LQFHIFGKYFFGSQVFFLKTIFFLKNQNVGLNPTMAKRADHRPPFCQKTDLLLFGSDRQMACGSKFHLQFFANATFRQPLATIAWSNHIKNSSSVF